MTAPYFTQPAAVTLLGCHGIVALLTIRSAHHIILKCLKKFFARKLLGPRDSEALPGRQ